VSDGIGGKGDAQACYVSNHHRREVGAPLQHGLCHWTAFTGVACTTTSRRSIYNVASASQRCASCTKTLRLCCCADWKTCIRSSACHVSLTLAAHQPGAPPARLQCGRRHPLQPPGLPCSPRGLLPTGSRAQHVTSHHVTTTVNAQQVVNACTPACPTCSSWLSPQGLPCSTGTAGDVLTMLPACTWASRLVWSARPAASPRALMSAEREASKRSARQTSSPGTAMSPSPACMSAKHCAPLQSYSA
jgi:hypothetical protein